MEKRILVVDDESAIVRMLCGHLHEAGFVTLTAADGDEALRVLHEDPVDLVLTDFCMPRMNGLELLNAIKVEFPRLPVVIMTGYANRENLDNCLRAGAEDYLSKPFTREALQDVIQLALKKAERLNFLLGNESGEDDSGELPENPLDGNW